MTTKEALFVRLTHEGMQRLHRVVEEIEKKHGIVLRVEIGSLNCREQGSLVLPSARVIHPDSYQLDVWLGQSYGTMFDRVDGMVKNANGYPAANIKAQLDRVPPRFLEKHLQPVDN